MGDGLKVAQRRLSDWVDVKSQVIKFPVIQNVSTCAVKFKLCKLIKTQTKSSLWGLGVLSPADGGKGGEKHSVTYPPNPAPAGRFKGLINPGKKVRVRTPIAKSTRFPTRNLLTFQIPSLPRIIF